MIVEKIFLNIATNNLILTTGPYANKPRTIFQRAIEACKLTWQDSHLKLVLREDCVYHSDKSSSDVFDPQGLPLWNG